MNNKGRIWGWNRKSLQFTEEGKTLPLAFKNHQIQASGMTWNLWDYPNKFITLGMDKKEENHKKKECNI